MFRIGTGGGPGYHRLSEVLTGLPRFAYNKLRPRRPASGRGAGGEGLTTESTCLKPQAASLPPASDFWALKDVSFEVQPGEVIGIIGRNGAGKSTLLKVLSRITEPTSGRFGVRGRVASLLEVGTGFHPELTGRENIYVSGITLGMTRTEVKKRFDEIVDFSGVEKFLDTPVKHYSSGMQVRLGFAVAAHLESEILIVDEVLAVGDAEFQMKCASKINQRNDGKSIILVSHDLTIIRQLCNQVLVLAEGRLIKHGEPDEMASYYQRSRKAASRTSTPKCNRFGLAVVRCAVKNQQGQEVEELCSGQFATIFLKIHSQLPILRAGISLQIRDELGQLVTSICNAAESIGWINLYGTGALQVDIPRLLLLPGEYTIDILVHNDVDSHAFLDEARICNLTISPSRSPDAPLSYSRNHGRIRIECSLNWKQAT